MVLTRTHAAVLLVTLATLTQIHAQTQTQTPQQPPSPPASQIPQPPTRPQPARAVIFLDPAHGGPETGGSLGNNVAEKDVTLAFAQRLRPILASAGFAVITTRDTDLTAPLPTDQRAETANRAHALACIVLHATAGGSGVHLYISGLPPALDNSSPSSLQSDPTTPFAPIPWESAQAGFVDQSRRLSDVVKATLAKTGLPVLTGSAPLRPLDNLMCPAVAIEIAPNSISTSPADPAYQQQVAAVLASALGLWRDQNQPASPSGAAQ